MARIGLRLPDRDARPPRLALLAAPMLLPLGLFSVKEAWSGQDLAEIAGLLVLFSCWLLFFLHLRQESARPEGGLRYVRATDLLVALRRSERTPGT